MSKPSATLSRLVDEARRAVRETDDDEAIVATLEGPVRAAALAGDWIEDRHRECDPAQGFGVHLLHEEPDHSLAVLAVAWQPGRGAPPHDHGTWAIVAGVEGAERNRFWRRDDDGSRPDYAEISEIGDETVGPGEVVTMMPADIHSVSNETDAVTLSLHVYGVHPNRTGRHQFDPETNSVASFQFKQEAA